MNYHEDQKMKTTSTLEHLLVCTISALDIRCEASRIKELLSQTKALPLIDELLDCLLLSCCQLILAVKGFIVEQETAAIRNVSLY